MGMSVVVDLVEDVEEQESVIVVEEVLGEQVVVLPGAPVDA